MGHRAASDCAPVDTAVGGPVDRDSGRELLWINRIIPAKRWKASVPRRLEEEGCVLVTVRLFFEYWYYLLTQVVDLGPDLDVYLAVEDRPLGMPLVGGIWENFVWCSDRNGSDIVMAQRNKNITSCASRRPYQVARRG